MSSNIDHASWVRVPEAAEILGVKHRVIIKMIDQGFLTVRKLPGSYRQVLRADLESAVERCILKRGEEVAK